MKKKKVPKNIVAKNPEKLPHEELELILREPNLSELRLRKEKLVEYEMEIDSGLESDTLDQLNEEDPEKQVINKYILDLFGDMDE